MKQKYFQDHLFCNWVYMNHNILTNPKERQEPYDLFFDKMWVTVEKECKNGYAFDKYLENLCMHKYVICPEGNGVDTHRLWESLYMA